jgi:hypothetical protein
MAAPVIVVCTSLSEGISIYLQEILYSASEKAIQVFEVSAWPWKIYEEEYNRVNSERCEVWCFVMIISYTPVAYVHTSTLISLSLKSKKRRII